MPTMAVFAFYAVEPDDPILKVYQRLFPAMFRPLGQMSEELRSHLRYPEDLFRNPGGKIQSLPYEDPAGILQQRRSLDPSQ